MIVKQIIVERLGLPEQRIMGFRFSSLVALMIPKLPAIGLFDYLNGNSSSEAIKKLPLKKSQISNGKLSGGGFNENLRVALAIKWIIQNVVEFDWIFKVDDDTFVNVELLILEILYRFYGEPKENLFYIGSIRKSYIPVFYAWGGAGYLLSRAATIEVYKNLVQIRKCEFQHGEDVTISFCLHLSDNPTVNIIDRSDVLHFEKPENILSNFFGDNWNAYFVTYPHMLPNHHYLLFSKLYPLNCH